MVKNNKQVMQGKGGRRTQRPTDSASTSMSIRNTKFRGKHKNKHTNRAKQDDHDVTGRRSLLNTVQRKLFAEKLVQKDGDPAYKPLYCYGLGWYKKNVISTYIILQ